MVAGLEFRSIRLAMCVMGVASLLLGTGCARDTDVLTADVCIYGGTSAGVAAAVTVAKQGRSVILIEPGRHLGGLSSGGLGFTDFGNKAAIGGLSRTFYRRLGAFYGQEEAWQFQPHHAEEVFREWVAQHKIPVLYERRLSGVGMTGRRINRILVEKAPLDDTGAPAAATTPNTSLTVYASMFIDATYEGDLMARAQVRYAVGREPVAQYGEPLNGIRASTPKHQFLARVDPYNQPGEPSSGLIPLIQSGDGGVPGQGDASVQAYNFRLCLTKDPANQLPLNPPANYNPARYELLARYVEALVAANRRFSLRDFLKIDMMPGGKTDINNNGAVSTDFIGFNYAYPNGSYATRRRIWIEHQDYIRGLLHFMATSPRLPQAFRDEMASWGYCKDEFTDTRGFPHQMYVREARRMIGRYVVTQNDCDHKTQIDDSIGLGAYNMDSHNCQRIVKNGAVENEGDVQVAPRGPYAVPYRAITPKAEECENLLVPVCLSATHIAYGSIRMEPVFMVLAESAGLAACQAIEDRTSVQGIDYARLRQSMLAAGQVLEFTPRAPQTRPATSR